MNISRFTMLALLVLVTSSCRMLFKSPQVQKIQDLKVESISVDHSKLKLSIIVHNPNSYDIRLSRLKLDLLDMNREKVGEASLQKEISLPGKKGINLEFDLSIQTRPMIRMISSINHDLQFFVAGKGEGKAMGISKSFEFEQPYSVEIKAELMDRIPSMSAGGQDLFKLLRTYVDDYGFSSSVLKADFILINAYGFSFKFKGFPADIFIAGKKVGSGDLENAMTFDENVFYQEGSMVFQLANLRSVWEAVKGAFKGDVNYTVKGTILIDAMGMELSAPYEYCGSVPISVWKLLLN
jgi:LEA14-like dessication related protein